MNNRQITAEKILSESLRLFGEKGYFDTTTKEIANNCGISETTLFYNFKDKETLFQEVINTYMNDSFEYLDAIGDQLTYHDCLEDHIRLAHAYTETVFSKIYVIRIQLGRVDDYPDTDLKELYSMHEMEQHYENYLKEAVAHGLLPDRDYAIEIQLFVAHIMRLSLDVAAHDQIYTLTPAVEERMTEQINHWCRTYVQKILIRQSAVR